jgi:hypothetical protein
MLKVSITSSVAQIYSALNLFAQQKVKLRSFKNEGPYIYLLHGLQTSDQSYYKALITLIINHHVDQVCREKTQSGINRTNVFLSKHFFIM